MTLQPLKSMPIMTTCTYSNLLTNIDIRVFISTPEAILLTRLIIEKLQIFKVKFWKHLITRNIIYMEGKFSNGFINNFIVKLFYKLL